MRLIDADVLLEPVEGCEERETCDGCPLRIRDCEDFEKVINAAPTIEAIPARGALTIDKAAEMLSNLFGNECACNFNNIDEWLPQRCKYCAAGECPDPSDEHGCWKQFLIHGYKLREGK